MRVLFAGPYRQKDGWGSATKAYIKALNTTSHNIAIRPVYLSDIFIDNNIDEDLIKLENNTYNKYDVIIQKVLPNYFCKFSEAVNIGFTELETTNQHKNFWKNNFYLVDKIMVTSQYEKSTLESELGLKNVHAVKQPIDTSMTSKKFLSLNIPVLKDSFNFYFIGEYSERKNIMLLIKAFNLEFRHSEPVNLVLKLNKPGVPPNKVHSMVKKDILEFKSKIRKYNNLGMYKPEILITDWINEEEMIGLHRECHCFVVPSRGEAFCRPAAEAMLFGNTPIATNNTGMMDFVTEDTGWRIDSYTVPVICKEPPNKIIYTSRETWQEPRLDSLMACMREAFESNRDNKKANCIKKAEEYSYQAVGRNISKVICQT